VAGQPVADAPVLFQVVAGDGSLGRLGEGERFRQVAVPTDPDGVARVRFILGRNAGSGAHLVEASSPGVTGRPMFTGSAEPGPAALVVLDGGGIQVGLVGAFLPEPLTVAVTDAGWNRLAGVPVHFEVVKGDGRFGNDEAEQTVVTDEQGRAAVRLHLDSREGMANNVVEASLGDREEGFVTFVASGRAVGEREVTSISGRVLDNTDVPVAGVTVTLEGTELTSRTDAEGRFQLEGVPVGTSHLRVDGTTAERPGTWPVLGFEVVPVPGRDNPFPRPIYLLPIDVERGLAVSETQGGVLTLPELPGLALEVEPGSVTFPDGSRSGVISVTVVHGDKVPMAPSFGAQPRLALTIQPAGTIFDPPASLTLPNSAGLAPGREIELVGFDHDVGRFVVFGPGVVSEDGLTISSIPGLGQSVAGWSFEATPAPTGTAHQCSPSCEIADGSLCIPGCPTPVGEPALLASSRRNGLEGGVLNVSAPGTQCEDCDEMDLGMCETNPHCEDGKCVGDPVEIFKLEGPCAASFGQRVTFMAESNAPAKVKWSVAEATPSMGMGPEFSTSFREDPGQSEDEEIEGVKRTVAAECAPASKSKEVAVARPCDLFRTAVLIEQIETELPPATSAWGSFRIEQLEPKINACVRNGERCAQLEEVDYKFSLNTFLGENGPKPISGPDDPQITPSTCERVIEDLLPVDRSGQLPAEIHQGEPVPAFLEFIYLPALRAHEAKHRDDFAARVLFPAVEGFQDEAASLCVGCGEGSGDFPVGAARIEWEVQYEIHRAAWAHDKEAVAHRVSNPILEELVLDIVNHIENSPNAQEFPPLCRGENPESP